MGISHLLDRYPETLSGGEAQRSSLARGLVRRPKVLLLDEPFASLDAPLRARLRQAFGGAQKRHSITTIFVTHDQDEALVLADRLVVLRNGKVEQTGTPQEVYDRPANRFVAGFVGSPPMNFLEGRLAHQDDRLWFEQSAVRLNIRANCSLHLSNMRGSRWSLGSDRRTFRLPTPMRRRRADFEATVTDREFQGDRWLVRCETTSVPC